MPPTPSASRSPGRWTTSPRAGTRSSSASGGLGPPRRSERRRSMQWPTSAVCCWRRESSARRRTSTRACCWAPAGPFSSAESPSTSTRPACRSASSGIDWPSSVKLLSPEDWERVHGRLLELAREDHRIVSAALTGSAAADAEDRWSDVDVFLGVAEGIDIEAVLADWSELLYWELGVLQH